MVKEKKIAIAGGTLIDGTGKKPLDDAVVVIEGTKIVDIGRKNTIAISND